MSDTFGDLTNVRKEYAQGKLDDDAPASPFMLFSQWIAAAQAADLPYNECALATADANGTPSVRIVLLKQFDEAGFCWFTDSNSTKGQALAANPHAELLFYWQQLERQVRVQGSVVVLPDGVTRSYFASRPRMSQLSALVSQQSTQIANRAALEARYKRAEQCYADKDIPLPEGWCGYRLIPSCIEFWQGREYRLHDRILYARTTHNGAWQTRRIQP